MKKPQANTRRLTQIALLVALELVMAYTPLGYLPVGPLSLSFLTVPVAIGAMLLGPGAGALLGGVFGVTSFADGLMGKSVLKAALLSINPFYCFMVCVVARVLCGWLCGLLFALLQKKLPQKEKLNCTLGALSAPLLNTLFFMSFLVLFYYNTDYVQNMAAKLGATNPLNFVALMVGVQGAIEAVVCCVIGAAVTVPLRRYLTKH